MIFEILSISGWDIPETYIAVGRISTLSIVRDIIVRCIDHSLVRVALGIVVEELVLIGAVARIATGAANQVSTGSLVGTDFRG